MGGGIQTSMGGGIQEVTWGVEFKIRYCYHTLVDN